MDNTNLIDYMYCWTKRLTELKIFIESKVNQVSSKKYWPLMRFAFKLRKGNDSRMSRIGGRYGNNPHDKEGTTFFRSGNFNLEVENQAPKTFADNDLEQSLAISSC